MTATRNLNMRSGCRREVEIYAKRQGERYLRGVATSRMARPGFRRSPSGFREAIRRISSHIPNGGANPRPGTRRKPPRPQVSRGRDVDAGCPAPGLRAFSRPYARNDRESRRGFSEPLRQGILSRTANRSKTRAGRSVSEIPRAPHQLRKIPGSWSRSTPIRAFRPSGAPARTGSTPKPRGRPSKAA